MHGSEPQIAGRADASIVQAVTQKVSLGGGEQREAAVARIEAVQPAFEPCHEAAVANRQHERDLLRRRPDAMICPVRLIAMQLLAADIHKPQRIIPRHPDRAFAELHAEGDDRVGLRSSYFCSTYSPGAAAIGG